MREQPHPLFKIQIKSTLKDDERNFTENKNQKKGKAKNNFAYNRETQKL